MCDAAFPALNCRIKGEVRPSHTRQSCSAILEQRAKFEKIRNRRQARKALTAVAGAVLLVLLLQVPQPMALRIRQKPEGWLEISARVARLKL